MVTVQICPIMLACLISNVVRQHISQTSSAPVQPDPSAALSNDEFPLRRCMCQYGGVPGPSAGAGGVLQVHHSGTQRDLSDTQTAPKHYGGTSEAAHQE